VRVGSHLTVQSGEEGVELGDTSIVHAHDGSALGEHESADAEDVEVHAARPTHLQQIGTAPGERCQAG
jgi:hypothetical protein